MAQRTFSQRLLSLALLGALTASAGDALHALTGTLMYPNPAIGLQASWVFPGFLLAFLAMGLGYWFLAPRLGSRSLFSRQPGNSQALAENLSFFFALYALSAFAHDYPRLLALLLYGLFLVRLRFSYDRIWLALLGSLLGVCGMFVEGLLGALHLVHYSHIDLFYVPYWLGGLYLHGAFALREGARFFLYR